MKKWLKILIFLVIIVLLIVGAVRLVKKKKAQLASTPIAKEYAVVVKTFKPIKKSLTLTTSYISLVKNDINSVVSSKFPGRVLYVKKEADLVKKGDVVAKIDDTNLKTKLNSLNLQIESTKNEISSTKTILNNLYKIHERTQKLLKVKGASIEQYEKEQNQIEATKAKLSNLQAKLSSLKESIKEIKNELTYATLKANIDGVVAKQFLHIGDLAMPGHPILKINSDKGNYLLVRVPKDIDIFGVVYKNKIFPVKKLNSTFNSLNEYRVDVKDKDLVEGQRVDIDVITYKGEAILLPKDTILNRDGKSYVLVVKGDKAEPKEINIVTNSQDGVVVKEDLEGVKLVVAKPDILLKLLSGIKLKETK
ncbi:efflux RND transporter periplasmic adaptor subunit [Nitrosophilus kaiyonis]|uniref:efflux RND transporter periplasmic adaptor subunit n=1 Tax=Nitrosophilus kaiyonis TaxID=2930200 RepID=UPI00248F604F|nr:efflux RND transporter periplasmic adaptor subunit [Nitrosophilus kaiyonis]